MVQCDFAPKLLFAAPETAGEEVHVGTASPAELFARIAGGACGAGRVIRLRRGEARPTGIRARAGLALPVAVSRALISVIRP